MLALMDIIPSIFSAYQRHSIKLLVDIRQQLREVLRRQDTTDAVLAAVCLSTSHCPMTTAECADPNVAASLPLENVDEFDEYESSPASSDKRAAFVSRSFYILFDSITIGI